MTREFLANLSCSSSSFEEGEPLEDSQRNESEEDSASYEVRTYQFQPERDGYVDQDEGPLEHVGHNQAERTGSTFCKKETVDECRCCKEIDVISEKIEVLELDCILDHPGFHTVCLDEFVLETAYYAYRQQYGNLKEILAERNRYIAYRQLGRWDWGYHDRDIGVALPSCAVDTIRLKFPNEGGDCTCFK